jgi:hypothetical protein
MADCYCTIGVFMLSPPQPMREAGIAAARKALALDDSLPEVRFSSGYVKFYMEWDWDGAEREFRLSQQLNPNYEQPSLFLSVLLAARGRPAESEAEAAKGLRADPLSGFAHFVAATPALLSRDWARALRMYQEAVELSPGLANPLWTMSHCLSHLDRHEEAIVIGERLVNVSQRAAIFVGSLGGLYVRAGRLDAALAIEAELDERRSTEYVSPFTLSLLKAALARFDPALDLLAESIEQRDFLLWTAPSLAAEYDTLRGSPRFESLVKKLGL